MKYDFKTVEAKWQKVWEDEDTFHAQVLRADRVPVPLRPGPARRPSAPFTAMDIVARKKRMQGYNVLFPIGLDAFGLPTENYAIKNHIHPAIVTTQNIAHFTSQLQDAGLPSTGTARSTPPTPVLQVDAVDLPPAVQARPGLQDHHARQLVHQLQVRAGQRGSRQRRVRALRQRGHPQGEEPVDAEDHRLRQTA